MSVKSLASYRAFAITLPSLTLGFHTTLALCALHISPLSSESFRTGPWFLIYNIVAACASILGLVGAVRMNAALVSVCVAAHATTLFLATLTLLNVILPIDMNVLGPIIPNSGFDVPKICADLEDLYPSAWDEGEWLQRCNVTFTNIKIGFGCMGLVLLAVQWWALRGTWRWSRHLREEKRHGGMNKRTDEEKAQSFTESKD